LLKKLILQIFYKQPRYLLETLLVCFALLFFRILPLDFASKITSKLALILGRRLKVNKLANSNLALAMPSLNKKQRRKIITKMWYNLGRIIGEFPHICTMSLQKISSFVDISPTTAMQIAQLKQQKKGGIIFSAHFGNWEIGPKILISQGLKVKTVYRPLNNPIVEFITARLRGVPLIKKSSSGNRQIINAIKNGEFVIILADQKITDGIVIDFFNREAITTTSLAKIAIKYNVPLIPGYILRKKKFRFSLNLEQSLQTAELTNSNEDIKKLTLQINKNLENIIKQAPEQWFWVHNRWKK
jgi:KDO2-lipid IV(A) lauroyltransferase